MERCSAIRRRTVALIGNPAAGKNAVFSEITGRRHGDKANAGFYYYKFNDYRLQNLPDTYSLFPGSEAAGAVRDFLLWRKMDCAVVVADAVHLQDSLVLVLQTMEATDNVVLLLNHWEAAQNKNICIDQEKLSALLGIPVVVSTARSGKGISELLEQVHQLVTGVKACAPARVRFASPIEQAARRCRRGLEKTVQTDINMRFLALRVLENDASFNAGMAENLCAQCSDDFDVLKGREILSRFNLDGENYIKSVSQSFLQTANRIYMQTVVRRPCRQQKKRAGKPLYIKAALLVLTVWLVLSAAVLILWLLSAKGGCLPAAQLLPLCISDRWLCLSGMGHFGPI